MTYRVVESQAMSELERLAEDYLIHCAARGLAPRTQDGYTYSLRIVFLPWCAAEGVRDISDLNTRTVDRFTGSLLARRRPDGSAISRYSVHTYVRPVRQMLTWASSIGEDVKAKPQLPSRPKPMRDALSREEIDILEHSATSERDQLIVRVFADCGLRLDELTKLCATDIKRSARQAHLRVMGKRSRVRDVPVPPLLLRRLEHHVACRPRDRTTDRIFLSSRRNALGEYEPLSSNGIYEALNDAARRSGLTKKVHPHVLRHSWMTEMLRHGMHPVQLSIIGGASLPVIMEHYTHLHADDAYDAMIRVLTAQTAASRRGGDLPGTARSR